MDRGAKLEFLIMTPDSGKPAQQLKQMIKERLCG
jgi:hypothetical protein